ncbi:MAG: alpha/beta hydrolase [Pseudomonadota bacterium]
MMPAASASSLQAATQAAAVRLVLLPGLHGSGELFQPLRQALPAEFAVQVVSYPSNERLDYPALVKLVLPQLPAEGAYVLLGESFSGPVAIEVARQAANPPLGLVLCCTFATCPQPSWSRWLQWVPTLPPLHWISPWVLRQMLFGRWGQTAQLKALRKALSKAGRGVLYHRLEAVHQVDVRQGLAACDMPIQYWQASDDRLVPPSAWDCVQEAAPDAQCVRFDGPHALLQACPERATQALVAFAGQLGLLHTPWVDAARSRRS